MTNNIEKQVYEKINTTTRFYLFIRLFTKFKMRRLGYDGNPT